MFSTLFDLPGFIIGRQNYRKLNFLLVVRCSFFLLVARYFLHVAHSFFFSSFVARYFLLVTYWSLLFACEFLLVTFCQLLFACYFLLVTFCKLLLFLRYMYCSVPLDFFKAFFINRCILFFLVLLWTEIQTSSYEIIS